MFDWLKRWTQKPSTKDLHQKDLSRFVSEGGPDPEEARNSDRREVKAIKAHKAVRATGKKHVAKKASSRKRAA